MLDLFWQPYTRARTRRPRAWWRAGRRCMVRSAPDAPPSSTRAKRSAGDRGRRLQRVRPVGTGSGLHRRRRLVADGGQAGRRYHRPGAYPQASRLVRAGRCCCGADVCRNTQPGGGAPGRTFAPEIEGYGRGRGRGSAPVQVENRGTVFARKPGISPASGVHFHPYRGSTNPVVPRVSVINPRNPRNPRFDFRGRT